jgi:hypothetical protein
VSVSVTRKAEAPPCVIAAPAMRAATSSWANPETDAAAEQTRATRSRFAHRIRFSPFRFFGSPSVFRVYGLLLQPRSRVQDHNQRVRPRVLDTQDDEEPLSSAVTSLWGFSKWVPASRGSNGGHLRRTAGDDALCVGSILTATVRSSRVSRAL